MIKFRVLLMVGALVAAQSVFAHDMSKACGDVAKACTDAGYTREDAADKRFWQDCMKPTLMNKKVDGVTVDAATVKTCRTDKIEEMKKEMAEFKKIS